MNIKEKVLTFINSISGTKIAYALVLGLVAKSLFVEPGYSTVCLLIPLLSFEAYKLYLKSKTPDPVRINQEVMKELDNLKSKLSALGVSQSVEPSKRRYF